MSQASGQKLRLDRQAAKVQRQAQRFPFCWYTCKDSAEAEPENAETEMPGNTAKAVSARSESVWAQVAVSFV